MGFFKKVKDILFDEEEYTEQIKITPEMRNEATPQREAKVEKPAVEVKKAVEEVRPQDKTDVGERELFKSDPTFPFFDFDEEEFDHQLPKKEVPKPVTESKSSNVLEYERKKKVEKRTDFGRYEKTEITETTERRKFKPSPIISPVYGILNQDYDKSDLVKKSDPDKVDIQTIRNKAFGEKKEEPKTTFYEETETVTILEPKEKEQKVKTIDELLEDTSDVVVDIDGDLEQELETIEEQIEPLNDEEVTQKVKVPEVGDTLENDLFDLIDSMYDSKEDGE